MRLSVKSLSFMWCTVHCMWSGARTNNNNTTLTYMSIYCNNSQVVPKVIPMALISRNHPIYTMSILVVCTITKHVWSCQNPKEKYPSARAPRTRWNQSAASAMTTSPRHHETFPTQTGVTADTRSGATYALIWLIYAAPGMYARLCILCINTQTIYLCVPEWGKSIHYF